ncbi:MAG: polyprenyl synthetase family protein [Phycisphaerales bacterium JB047]
MNPQPKTTDVTIKDNAQTDLGVVVQRIDEYIDAFLRSRSLPANLHDAVVYSVLGGGKRLRPALAWYSAIACGGTGESTLTAGTAVELIHAFSLIHDDLPALDDDDLRRGRPTLHKHAGEAMAILAGDALLSLAYEAVLQQEDTSIAQRLCNELATGTRSMIAGQVYDTLGGFPSDLNELQKVELIHRNKTGALLRASCRMGAICAGASEQCLSLVTTYAESIGLQFQIVDDLLDVEGSSEAVGKALGKDVAAGKRTYPALIGVEASRSLAQKLGEEAQLALEQLEGLDQGDVNPLRQLGDMLTHRTA